MSIDARKRIARLISNIFNPFLVSLVMLLLVSLASISNVLDALSWALILIALSILPVFLSIVYLTHRGRLDGFSISIRGQRTRIYGLAGACAGAGYVLLSHLGAPPIFLATFVAGLSTVVVFMGVNLLWKISAHTAFMAASVVVLVILYGLLAAVTVALVASVSWARIELGHHSLAQVVSGALLAASIAVVVFHLFGLI
ncbi:hypothetical protein ACFLTZ_01365 [Chloroflexota bacterium]